MPSILRAALIAACAVPTFAHADHAPTVDSVIVTANPDPEDPPVVGEARKRLSETPGAVAVVAAESYQDRYAAGLADSLRDAPGVYAQKKWGDDVRLSIRGSGIGNPNHNRGLLLAQDGVPFNEADGYGDSQLIDPLIARYTEVWKGGNALRFGGALLGGAVNLVTPTGRTAGHETVLRLDGGSWDTLRAHGEVARTSGDWDVFAAATLLTADGWREQSAQGAARLSLNVGRTFGEDREVRLILSAADIHQEIPGALTLANALSNPEQAVPGNVTGDYQRDMRSVRAVVQTRWRLSEATVFEGGAYAVWKDLFHPIFQVIDQESRNWGVFGRFDWQGQAFGRPADAFYGAWVRSGDMDAQRFVNLAASRGDRTAAGRQNARALDAFAEGRVFVRDDLAVVAGGTWGRAERDYDDLLAPANDASKTYDWFAPRVGLLWQGTSGAQVFANLTRSVEPPNFSALVQAPIAGFVALAPQEAWTAEVGTRGRSGALTWDVTLYRATLENELLNFAVAGDIPAPTFNADKTVHQGVEAGLDWRFAPHWRLRQTWSWSDFRFDGDPVHGDNRLPVVPEHLYRAELRYEHHDGWFVAPSLEWAPRDIVADYANTRAAPSYAVWSLNAGWAPVPHVRLFLDARNLTDERYVSNLNATVTANDASAIYWPGEGRSLFGGLTLSF